MLYGSKVLIGTRLGLKYVSVDAALWRRNIDDWISVADVEKERYDELKVIYSRKKQ